MSSVILSVDEKTGLYECRRCGKGFSDRKRRFCGGTCRKLSYRGQRARRLGERVCQWCKKVFIKESRETAHCSMRCALKHRAANEGKAVDPVYECQQCKRSFIPKKANRKRFCSRECAFDYQKKMAKGKGAGSTSFTLAAIIPCRQCGVIFS